MDVVCNGVESTLDDESKSESSSGNDFVRGLVDPLNNILPKSVKSSPSLPPTSTLSTLIEKIVDAIDEYIRMSDVVKEEHEEVIQLEILHRIDETTVFAFLDDTDLKSIAQHIVDQTVKRAQKERNIDIGIGPLLL